MYWQWRSSLRICIFAKIRASIFWRHLDLQSIMGHSYSAPTAGFRAIRPASIVCEAFQVRVCCAYCCIFRPYYLSGGSSCWPREAEGGSVLAPSSQPHCPSQIFGFNRVLSSLLLSKIFFFSLLMRNHTISLNLQLRQSTSISTIPGNCSRRYSLIYFFSPSNRMFLIS